VGRGLLLLALAATAWVGWRAYDHRAAIREAPAAGCTWQVREPIALIRADWRAAFQKETWTKSYWSLNVGEGRELASLRPLLLRLRPTVLTAWRCKDANLDALRGLAGLQSLNLGGCDALQNVDALKGLSGLQHLNLIGCPALQNVDALKGLSGLQHLRLSGCTALQNVDALKGLSSLESLELNDCTALQNVDGLQGLSGLQDLYLTGCPALQNVDAFKGLSGLQTLYLFGCTALQNVDGLKGLSGLKEISLIGGPKLPASAVAELRAALPKTTIVSD
jgi:Leucine-rich repeat (LRR) protein